MLYTVESLCAEQNNEVESALWAAMRALEEGASLARRLAATAERNKQMHMMKRFQQQAQDKMEQAEVLRRLILQGRETPVDRTKSA
jgi:two-component system, chemotaxis family, protein-glutamate methylesterase/glutaminase